MKTDEPVRKGAYGDAIDESIIGFLAAGPASGVTLREVIDHLKWAYCCSTRERATHRLQRMARAGAVTDSYIERGHKRGHTCKVYRYVRPLHAEDDAKPAAAEPQKAPEARKPIPLKRLPEHLRHAVEAARSRFDPVEPLSPREFILGQFTVSDDELLAIIDREPGVLSRVADRFLAGGAGA